MKIPRIVLALLAAALVPACGSSGISFIVSSAGTAPLNARGGNGSAGAGGGGGTLTTTLAPGVSIEIRRSGAVDASFDMPDFVPILGANPRTIAGDTTYTIGAAGLTTVAAGATTILGDDGVSTATGLWVRAGVTLQLPANRDVGVDGLFDEIRLSFPDGVRLDGTLRLGGRDLALPGDGAGPDGSDVVMIASSLVSLPGSAVSSSGGGIALVATAGLIVNHAAIDAAGRSGAAGGIITFAAVTGLYNAGALNASGGDSSAGAGGAAGSVLLTTTVGPLANRGAITARGGDGATAGGDSLQGVTLSSSFQGSVLNSGAINKRGGHAASSGPGGSTAGGAIVLASGDGPLRNSGALGNRGGNGAPAAAGGLVHLSLTMLGNTRLPAELACSGAIDVGGGNGTIGGAGGEIRFSMIDGGAPLGEDNPLLLAGYAAIDLSGGDGSNLGAAGGLGGVMTLNTDGALRLEPALSCNGGRATVPGAVAGNGGLISLNVGADLSTGTSISNNGGDSLDPNGHAGNAGPIILAGARLVLRGFVSARGGDLPAAPAFVGGTGGSIELLSGVLPADLDGYAEVRGGLGTAPGAPGTVTVNLSPLALTNGRVNF